VSEEPAVKILLLATLALLVVSHSAAAAGLNEAAAVVTGLDALQGEVELWPGFDPWSIPVAVFDALAVQKDLVGDVFRFVCVSHPCIGLCLTGRNNRPEDEIPFVREKSTASTRWLQDQNES